MKKTVIALLTLLCLLFFGCSGKTNTQSEAGNAEQTGDVINITEKMFVTYVNEIYTNTRDYIGRTIKLEGMYAVEATESSSYYYVYRVGPGCCGNDGSMCGFEFTYNGDMPKDNDWIEVTGALRSYEENGKVYLTLDANSVKVLDVRGAETVAN